MSLSFYKQMFMIKNLRFRDKNISYKQSGTGPALILLHGFLESKEIWEQFSKELSSLFTVIAIDLPGHGESELVAETHSMPLMAECVVEVLKQEKIEKTVIVGHSMGGYVAVQFASDYPDRVSGLVFFHSHAAADSEEAKENRRRTINIVQQNKGGFIRQFIPDLFDQKHVESYSAQIETLQSAAARMTPESIIAALSGMRDREAHFKYLLLSEIPVLFIIGKQDSRMPYNQILAQAIIPSHSEVLLLEDVGHMGYIEAPVVTLKAVKHFALKCFE